MLVVFIAGAFIAFNFVEDDFGLFGFKHDKRIWTLEKTSKYLLSFRYIPQNFEGLLIGPSYSGGYIDTRKLSEYKIYNLSMDAGNASELRVAAENALERGHFRFIVICLTPYFSKDHGMKGPQISPKEYWGSLFSWLPIEILKAKWSAYRHPELDYFANTEWGAARPISPHIVVPWNDYIKMQLGDPMVITIDPVAYADLQAIIATARRQGTKVFGYFYPYDRWLVQSAAKGEWDRYRAAMLKLFDPKRDVVLDMLTPEYDALRADVSCYTDAHLSEGGAQIVLGELQRMLDAALRDQRRPATIAREGRVCPWSKSASGFDHMPVVSASTTPPPETRRAADRS
jgi:hypothetical protein